MNLMCVTLIQLIFFKFVNKVTEEENLEELEELIYRLRKSPSAADTLPSTGHAVIRTLCQLDKTDMLFRILNDRMNYGIFLDFYTANLLMDKFLVNGYYRGNVFSINFSFNMCIQF